jgi:hypothetical protein
MHDIVVRVGNSESLLVADFGERRGCQWRLN